ncbi:MAG TPA: hypothetical protein VN030_12265 [Cellvibrio sp.]|nr:hypothetical protein [Cellvibrio sp.]
MAFFWFSKYNLKSNGYAVLQRYILKYSPLYEIRIDPQSDTYQLIEQFCKQNPDVFKYDLHRVCVASGALLLGLENCYSAGSAHEANFFLFCLGQILMDIETEEDELKLSGYDRKFIAGCGVVYIEYSQKLADSSPDLASGLF